MNALHALAAACMGLASLMASAAGQQPIAPYEPVQGAWYPDGAPGIYVNVDIGPAGFTFVAIHDFVDGRERTRYLQGPLEQASDADWESTGIRARMVSPVYVQEGGSCLGCPFVHEQTRDLNVGNAEIRFRNGSTGTLLIQGQEIAISRYPMYVDAAGLLQNRVPGKWIMASRTRLGDRIDTVTIAPFGPILPNTYLTVPADVPDLLPPSERWFSLVCNTCAQNGLPLLGSILVVHDGGKMVLYSGGGGFGIHTFFAAYRLTDLEGKIQGRAIPSVIQKADGYQNPTYVEIHDFTLVPLPADWRQ
jgi:hypothetical protein